MPRCAFRALPALLMLLPGCAGDESSGTQVIMQSTIGAIEIEIFTDRAPVTAANFLRLVDGGHLDGAVFYRTVSPANDNGKPVISVIQGGIGGGTQPFASIGHEPTAVTGLRHVDGSISMARSELGTASTEFFICLGDQPALDSGGTRNADGQGFAVFGLVVSGMDVVHAIHRARADAPTEFDYFRGQLLDAPVRIESVRRVSPSMRRPEAASDTAR